MNKPVAVDAMGGDRAPEEIVKGARLAREEFSLPVVLVGPPDAIRACPDYSDDLEIVPASEVIEMAEDPALAIRTKRDSSLVRCAELVADGRCAGMVSAGNTGAAMASALFRLGRIRGVSRPAIATTLPIPNQKPVVLIDSGANAECRPEWLAQFATMGAVYWKLRFGDGEVPRVGLLTIGEEEGKGNTLTKETYALLAGMHEAPFRFVGNVEGRDILSRGADVVTCDGFTGNVALKTMEGSLKFFLNLLLAAFNLSEEAKELGKKVLELVAPTVEQIDPETTGGALLLGVRGVCVISHGSSSAKAIKNAIKLCAEMFEDGLVERIETLI